MNTKYPITAIQKIIQHTKQQKLSNVPYVPGTTPRALPALFILSFHYPSQVGAVILFYRWGHWGLKKLSYGASPVAQWLRICLLMQGTRVWALVWEDPTCRGTAGPVSHNCWACASGACAPQREGPRWWEARAPRWRVAPAPRWGVAPACRN